LLGARAALDEFLLEKMFRSLVQRLKNFVVRARTRCGRMWETHASAIVEVPRGDVWMWDSEDDGYREALRLMVIVASEERIDGAVETGNPDPLDQNHPLSHGLNYNSANQTQIIIMHTADGCQLCWLQLWFMDPGLCSPDTLRSLAVS